jgi:hypothetical protein
MGRGLTGGAKGKGIYRRREQRKDEGEGNHLQPELEALCLIAQIRQLAPLETRDGMRF